MPPCAIRKFRASGSASAFDGGDHWLRKQHARGSHWTVSHFAQRIWLAAAIAFRSAPASTATCSVSSASKERKASASTAGGAASTALRARLRPVDGHCQNGQNGITAAGFDGWNVPMVHLDL